MDDGIGDIIRDLNIWVSERRDQLNPPQMVTLLVGMGSMIALTHAKSRKDAMDLIEESVKAAVKDHEETEES